MAPIQVKIKRAQTLEQVKQLLSPQELEVLSTYYSPCPYEYTQVPKLMNTFMTAVHSLATSKDDPIKFAAFAHEGITGIHAFRNGHGRVARLISFLILLKARRMPYIMADFGQEYSKVAQASHQNISILEKYLSVMVEGVESIEEFGKNDLNGISIETPLDEAEIKCIKELFDSFKITDSIAKQKINQLKQYVKRKLNLFNDACQVCGKAEKLSACSGCKLIKYCSKDCQKDNWPRHKKLCPSLKESLSEGALANLQSQINKLG